ncbi:MAG: hypothetical protein KatS3mg024_1060 [Armatimonadota bacterium]|nr:MAG: hypothetical protein KatS3mg024_1060 [Armatimonadota bacterium]
MPIHETVRTRLIPACSTRRSVIHSPSRPLLLLSALTAAAVVALAPVRAQGMLRGEEYLRQSAESRAVAVAPGERPAGGGTTLDIAGTLSGTMGSGEGLALLILSGGTSYAVRCGAIHLPPLGAEIRVLARIVETAAGQARLELAGWAFASDVEKAGSARRSASPAGALDARKRGPSAARGATVDHTGYFRQYADAISRINPRLSRDQVEQITRVLLNTSRECDVDPRLVMAVILAESGFNPNATSRKGAMGLGQLMPATARGMGLQDPYEPTQNLDASIRIIRSALNRYSGNAGWKDLNWEHLKLALAAYNAGAGAVKKYGGVPPYPETQNYIAKVASYYRQLCGEDSRTSR